MARGRSREPYMQVGHNRLRDLAKKGEGHVPERRVDPAQPRPFHTRDPCGDLVEHLLRRQQRHEQSAHRLILPA
jgi:hypothetical protein